MRSLFPLILGILSVPCLAGETDVLKPGEAGATPRTMLSRDLLNKARRAFQKRREAVAALKNVDDLEKRRSELKAKFIASLGGFPDKTPLNPRIVGILQRDGYRVEKIIYESRPNHHVTANFYLPAGDPPFPAVLIPCGHEDEAKAAINNQRACISLAKHGIAALCYDPIGQGERRQLLDNEGKPIGGGGTTEHTTAGIGALLVGRQTASYRIWDAIRSLDYLASRSEIDPKRLGCSGCSGGGTMTSYLMALDDRVAAAAPSCYITSLERLFETIGPQDAEQNIVGQTAFGMEHADYLSLRAPKPTLICASTRDFFDIQGTWNTFREAKQIYALFGRSDAVDIVETNETHGYNKLHREGMLRLMLRRLAGKDVVATEGDFDVASEAELRCTKTGRVVSELHGKSVFDWNEERAAEFSKKRKAFLNDRDRAGSIGAVRRLIGVAEPIKPAARSEHGGIRIGERRAIRLIFQTEPGIEVPALLFTPETIDDSAPLTIVIGLDKSKAIDPDGAIAGALKRGRRVLIADLRGTGETAPETANANHGPFGADWKEAFLALHLSEPLLGRRVFDLLSVIGATAAESQRGVHLIAYGQTGPIALHAAAIDSRIHELTLIHSIASWYDIVRRRVSRDQLSNIVPGALEVYDLPELAGLIAPRPLAIVEPVDPSGVPIAREEVELDYSAAIAIYHDRNSEDVFTIQSTKRRTPKNPLLRAVDLKIGETQTVKLSDGKTSKIKLLQVDEVRDPIRSAVRSATVKLEVNGSIVSLESGNYHLPILAGGVQIDCPVVGGYLINSNQDSWGLSKDARIRLWPAGSPWIEPDRFGYPARQRWFASSTQMANEPVYVDGGENPSVKKIYYHNGLDIGGAEGMIEVVAASDGVIVGSGTEVLKGYENAPVRPRYDLVVVLDDQGWYYSYHHLQSIDHSIKPGIAVRKGQKIGMLGKEGGSGGWSHLHFMITSLQPSGRWGTQEGYAFLWQAYLREHEPAVIAVARPHRVAWAGDTVVLDASKSWARSGPIERFEWTFCDGSTATGSRVEKVYNNPGSYSEIVKTYDRDGRFDYDFAIVQVLDRAKPDPLPPTIHASYAPTFGIKPNDEITFKVRTFRTTDGNETWDFGDGSPSVAVRSDGNVEPLAHEGYAITKHRYQKPGRYLVKVERTDRHGATATARLRVIVE
jgi:murein DD-endopeptidase MepM/ murein hydrolase activator NlpD/cephalosporin-C deacetylase-like acetyl esterase